MDPFGVCIQGVENSEYWEYVSFSIKFSCLTTYPGWLEVRPIYPNLCPNVEKYP
jgi:hypothetical protein